MGRWANEHKHAAAAILNKQTYYLDVEDTYQGIKNVDLVPSLSPYNLEALQINKDFMLSHGYIEHDFDVYRMGRAGIPGEGGDGVLEEEWKKRSMARLPQPTTLDEAMSARLG